MHLKGGIVAQNIRCFVSATFPELKITKNLGEPKIKYGLFTTAVINYFIP